MSAKTDEELAREVCREVEDLSDERRSWISTDELSQRLDLHRDIAAAASMLAAMNGWLDYERRRVRLPA